MTKTMFNETEYVFKVKGHFTELPNIVFDLGLTYTAIGVYAKICKTRNIKGWKIYQEALKDEVNGDTKVRNAMKELIKVGLVTKEQLRDAQGHICGVKYVVYDIPQNVEYNIPKEDIEEEEQEIKEIINNVQEDKDIDNISNNPTFENQRMDNKQQKTKNIKNKDIKNKDIYSTVEMDKPFDEEEEHRLPSFEEICNQHIAGYDIEEEEEDDVCSSTKEGKAFQNIEDIESKTNLVLTSAQEKIVSNWDNVRLNKSIIIFNEQDGVFFKLLNKIYRDDRNFIKHTTFSSKGKKSKHANFTEREYDCEKLEKYLLGEITYEEFDC